MKKQKTARQSSDAEPEGADCGKECSLAAEQMKKQTAVHNFDAEPEDAHYGKARSQSPPAG